MNQPTKFGEHVDIHLMSGAPGTSVSREKLLRMVREAASRIRLYDDPAHPPVAGPAPATTQTDETSPAWNSHDKETEGPVPASYRSVRPLAGPRD